MAGPVVAVMQPYFFPYLGYFRLFAVADVVVLYDCVQFPRRGRVHRCSLPSQGGGTQWLTLPLARQPQHVRIHELRFAAGAASELERRLSIHTWYRASHGPLAAQLRQLLPPGDAPVSSYLEQQIRFISEQLTPGTRMIRSSDLDLPDELKGQQRVLSIVRSLGGSQYINSPGGRALYDPDLFRRWGINLAFLSAYAGSFPHALPALLSEDPQALRRDIETQTIIEAT